MDGCAFSSTDIESEEKSEEICRNVPTLDRA